MEKSSSFRIKVISDNLILVEADGFDREIFQPYIKNGKIQIFNLIPAKENPVPKVYTRKRNILGDLSNSADTRKKIQILQNISVNPSLPLVLSTNQIKLEGLSQYNNETWNCSSFPQPNSFNERKSPAGKPLIQSTPLKVNKTSPVHATPHLGPNVKVIRLHRKPTTNSPRKVAKVLPQCSSPNNRSTLTTSTPVFSRHARRRPPQSPPPPTITKWRKCITPLKTYSRLAKRFVKPANSPGLLRRHQLFAYQNNYMRGNNTQGFYGEFLAGFKRVATKIDSKTAISPARFKAQLRNWSDITKNRDDEILPKTKTEFRNSQTGCSYDLITHSARNHCYAGKLQRMFKKRCVQKFAPIDKRIKHLVEPLEPLEYEEPRPNTRRMLLV